MEFSSRCLSQAFLIFSFTHYFNSIFILTDEIFSDNKIRNYTINSRITFNESKYYSPKRKSILILNGDKDLRTTNKKNPKKITNLLYQEFDDEGKVLNKHEMHNLDDVLLFFGILFFVCCTLSLTQDYYPEDEPIRRSILPPPAYIIITAKREYANAPYALIVNPEMQETAKDKMPREVLESLLG